jgi:soluble P-type ATPase
MNERPAGIHVRIPGGGGLVLYHLVMDLNGMLAVDGQVIDGVPERLAELRNYVTPHLLTAGTHGNPEGCSRILGLQPQAIASGTEKANYVRALGAGHVVTLGNGANDVEMMDEATLSIAVLGAEGLCSRLLSSADVIVMHPCDGLDLLLKPTRLIATLRW